MFYYIAINVRSIESFTIYTSALNSISSSVVNLMANISNIYEGLLYIDNLKDFFAQKGKIGASENIHMRSVHACNHEIEFNDVCFKYPGNDKYVLKDINFKIETGEPVFIIGQNGAGKSTLIKLLMRLYDPTEGTIYLDGYNINEYNIHELYKIYGALFQDYNKFAGKVGENISFGRGEETGNQKEIIDASKMSNADVFIHTLNKKYDTYLTRYFENEGIDLSIGQWQRLALARAMYSKSAIMVFDEPAASLDLETERKVYASIEVMKETKVIIIVSHKLSNVKSNNQIIMLKEGEVAETGTHADLVDRKGEYCQLLRSSVEGKYDRV